MRRSSSDRRFRSQSRSSSSSTDNPFPPRGRSPTQRRRLPRRDDAHSSRESSAWRGVRFDSHSQHPSGRDSLDMSPYGSSNATKVEDARAKVVAMPFLCWRRSGMSDTASSPEMTDQELIKLLDHIDEQISEDAVGNYYLRVAEFTMDDVVSRHECLYKAVSVSVGVNNPPTPNIEGITDHSTPSTNETGNSTISSPERGLHEDTSSSRTQALGLTSHDQTIVKQLVGMSQQIVWPFIPNIGGAVIHTLMKRFWGCVDSMCLVSNFLSSVIMLMVGPV